MIDELRPLFERLAKIQALYDAPGTAGEQAAAAAAAERLRERIRDATPRAAEPAIEFRLTLEDAWSRKLFLAIARHHGVSPFRYRGQRRTTVMLKATRSLLHARIIPHFEEAQAVLREHFDKITAQLIRDSLHESDEEAVEATEPPSLPDGR